MNPMKKFIVDFLECTSGAALIEMVLVFPIVGLLLVGGFDLGIAFNTQATAQKSLRDAVRYLSEVPMDAICTWGLTHARNIAVYGQESTGTTPLIPGYKPSDVQLVLPSSCSGLTDPVTIALEATIPYPNFFPLPNIGLPATLTLTAGHEEVLING